MIVCSQRRRRLGAGAFLLALIVLTGAAPANAAQGDPLFTFSPEPAPPPLPGEPPPALLPPPNGYLNDACGLTIDSGGRFYVADHHHDTVDVYSGNAPYGLPSADGRTGYITQLSDPDPDGGPCPVAVDSAGVLYVADYHGGVERFVPSAYPPDGDTTYASQGEVVSSPTTGIAVDRSNDEVYVNRRDHVAVYDSAGAHQRDIGLGTLGDAYGVAVSGFASTSGNLYVPDAANGTVEVFDAAGDPLASIAGPPGGFSSLRDASVAVDDQDGNVYVVDNRDPARTESPWGIVRVFSSGGAYLGHLKHAVIHGDPTGLAVDNSTNKGRVFLTSGNTHNAGIYVFPPNGALQSAPLPPEIPPEPLGADSLFPTVPIGAGASSPGGTACEGDNCQALPPAPVDPTLTTLVKGLGNPPARYSRYSRSCGPLARAARELARRQRLARKNARRAARAGDLRRAARLRSRAAELSDSSRRAERLTRRCRRANRRLGATVSASATRQATVASAAKSTAFPRGEGVADRPPVATRSAVQTAGLLPAATGFDATVYGDGGEIAALAGSHPYSIELDLGLDQGDGDADLRELRVDLPAGVLANPAATPVTCSAVAFGTPRTSPFESSASGESCPDRTQVGTVDVTTGVGGETRRFGLFNLDPVDGAAFQLGAAPFGEPLIFNGNIGAGGGEAPGLTLSTQVPQALQARALGISLWGTPWDTSHDVERGNCLSEAAPDFPWSKCSIGEPLDNRPIAFLTLPTDCSRPISFAARATAWQQAGDFTATALGAPAVSGCETLGFESFDFKAEGLLSVKKASSSSGFVFRLFNTDEALANPRRRIRSHPERAVVQLPQGVTLNPSLGAGLEVCKPVQLAAETAFNPPGAGCPNGSKLGVFSVRVPFYDGILKGSIYLAQPDHPSTGAPGAENPFDSLLAVYLVAKSVERGILIRVPGELSPAPGDGTLTATFDGLPQLPYTDLEINFRSGQRAPLVSPPRCGAATTEIEISPSSGAGAEHFKVVSPVDSGIDLGPCPNGATPPFNPGAIAGGVNSNVGSYTPYFVHLSRRDTEQEITSYSLILPKGITGKLAGIPFCPDAAIEAARHRQGFDETASPSCPIESQVGRTDTGYGVGPALTYAPGRIYLAGPYKGSPLSLVTINAATVGPFDLGTIVIRSAFDIDEHTAQLQIDSSASDPIPHIIDGVPLHLRDVRIYMDRFQFTHNPSSCEASQLTSTLTGSGATLSNPADDSTATVTKHFQLLNCLTLGFRPKLGLRLQGSARHGGYPSLRTTFVSRGARDSNLKRIEVEMPHALFLAQNHIRTVCTREQFAAEKCPAGSIYGRATAETLLFDAPLRGNVYLRSSTGKLPDLVADLRSGAVRIVVEGRIGPGRHGGILTFFDNLPDAPLDRFTMTLFGGKRGLLQNSVDICRTPPLATVSALGQNNIGANFSSELRGQCKKAVGKHPKGR